MQHYVTHYSLPFTSSSPIRKEQRKNEKSLKNLAFWLGLGHGRRSNSSRRCRLHSRSPARSPLPFAAARRRPHFRRPSPVLQSCTLAARRSQQQQQHTAAPARDLAQVYACDSFPSVDFPAIWAYA